MSIVDHGSFEVDDYMKEGCKVSGCDYSFYKGHFYSGFAPGISFLVIPFYIITKAIMPFLFFAGYTQNQVATTIVIILSAIFLFSLFSTLTSVLVYKFVSQITKNKKHRLIIPFIFSFGTLFFVYSTGFYPRIVSTLLVFLSFYLLFKFKKEKSNNLLLFIAGFCSAFAVTIDFPQIITLGLLFLYLISFDRSKNIFYFLLGVAIPLIFLTIYNYMVYDSLSPSSYTYRARMTQEMSYNTLEYGASLPSLDKAISFLFSLKYGLFTYMPILFISIFGFWFGIKNKEYSKEMLLFLFIAIAQFLFYISYTVLDPCSFGLRYLLPILPFLIIPIVFVLNKKIFTKSVIFLSSISVLVNFLGTSIYFGCVKENLGYYFKTLINRGVSSYTLTLISEKFIYLSDLTKTAITFTWVIFISLIIYFIWKK